MRRAIPPLIAAILLTVQAQGAQTVTAVNERAGLFNCACPQGVGSGPIHVPALSMAWQRYDQLNTRITAISNEMGSCLAEAASGRGVSARCSNLRSEEASLRTQAVNVQAQAQAARAQAPGQCTARCNAGAAATQQRAPQSSSPGANGAGGKTPVGNDWRTDNTISGQRPIDGLSETQRKWQEDKQRALRAFKPLRTAQGTQTGARADDARAQLLERVSAALSTALPRLLLDELSATGRAWTTGAGSERDAALQRLKALRLLALAEIAAKEESARSPAEREIALYLENEYLFETVLIPAAIALPKKDDRK